MLSYAITFAALAASATAINPFNLVSPGSPVRAVMPRQTDAPGGDNPPGGPFGGGFDQCHKDFFGLMRTLPVPPREIIKWVVDYGITATGAFKPMPTDVCPPYITDIPGSLVGGWMSYQSDLGSWASDHSADYSSAISACPSNGTSNSISFFLPSIGPCKVTPTAIAEGSDSDDDDSDDDDDSSSGSSSKSSSVSRSGPAPSAGSASGSGSGNGASGLNAVVAAAGAGVAALIGAVALHY
jgi:hypothetical protein